VAIAAAISPYREVRDELRRDIGSFVEVYVSCPISVLAERDVKGLYKKALAGEIKNFTGIDDPYEAPVTPEVTVFTDTEPKEESLARILHRLEELGHVATSAGGRHHRHGAHPLISPHGGELISRRAPSLGAAIEG